MLILSRVALLCEAFKKIPLKIPFIAPNLNSLMVDSRTFVTLNRDIYFLITLYRKGRMSSR